MLDHFYTNIGNFYTNVGVLISFYEIKNIPYFCLHKSRSMKPENQ